MRSRTQERRSQWQALAATGILLLFALFLLHWAPRSSPAYLTSTYLGNDAIYSGSPTLLSGSPQSASAFEQVGTVLGNAVDDAGQPANGVEVELIPTWKTGDAQWYATQIEWTDKAGSYAFKNIEPGEYTVAFQKRNAPDGEHPFASRYYPGVDSPADSSPILVVAEETTQLHSIKLQRIRTVTIPIEVAFSDASIPAWSNLLFSNPLYEQAVIGDIAPGVENGRGRITLPLGFKYLARAKVDCEGEKQIESRESEPVQSISLEAGEEFPAKLTFIIPGPACKLWTPK